MISLIISVYNKTSELEAIINALRYQKYKEFEVIFADDGSGPEIKQLCSKYKKESPFDIIHVWQKDEGFRKDKILNKAINASKTDYLIFIDGDCLPQKYFIKEHFDHREKDTVLCGNRVDLSKGISAEILKKRNDAGSAEENMFTLLKDSLKLNSGESVSSRSRTTRMEEAIHIKSDLIHKLIRGKKTKMLGANFSLPKDLLLKVNGFDENYEGPGIGEDTDIEYRLKLAGAKFKSVRNKAILYHLYHQPLAENTDNLKYFEEVKKKNEYRCENGLVK